MSGSAAAGRRPLLWVICGAGRGVGKTHLARSLCRALPGAVCAKQGTSPRRPEKAENYFRTDQELDAFCERERDRLHVVVESNALVRRGKGDIIIYLGGEGARASSRAGSGSAGRRGEPATSPGHSSPGGERPDAGWPRATAHIVLGEEDGAAADWRAVLEQAGLEAGIVETVLATLVAQAEWKRETGQ